MCWWSGEPGQLFHAVINFLAGNAKRVERLARTGGCRTNGRGVESCGPSRRRAVHDLSDALYPPSLLPWNAGATALPRCDHRASISTHPANEHVQAGAQAIVGHVEMGGRTLPGRAQAALLHAPSVPLDAKAEKEKDEVAGVGQSS
jgi:hypothetical protein